MKDNFSVILSVLLFACSLIDLGFTFGFNQALNFHGVQYTIGNWAVYGPSPYDNLIPFIIIVVFFSFLAFLSLFIQKKIVSKSIGLTSLLIISFFYVVIYLEKTKYLNDPDNYFYALKETILVEKIGLTLAVFWGLFEIFQLLDRTAITKYKK